MHFKLIFAASATFLSLVNTAPTGSVGTVDTTSTVIRKHTGKQFLRHGPKAMAKTFRKYGSAVPEHVRVAAAATSEAGTVIASPTDYDQEYLSPVQIGTPPQTVMLDFDTGSADLWVFSSQLPTTQTSGHSIYNPALSSTARHMTGFSWTISYGDRSGATGDVYTDTVTVGGVTVTTQAVEAAQSVSAQFQRDQNLDGILGLAGPTANQIVPVPQYPFFRNARSSLYKGLFCANLRQGTAGSYDFGFINVEHYTGDIHYTPTPRSKGFWDITPDSYSVEGTSYGSPGSMIVDTGTSLIFLPDAAVSNYYNHVPSAYYDPFQGGAVFRCSEVLPDLTFTFSGAMRTVPGRYLNYVPLMDGSGYCFGGLQSAYGLPFSILGDVFIKSQYVIFDAGFMRVGFADQA